MITFAGAAAAASRPPLKLETCLRTTLTSVIGIPAESSSLCSSDFSAAVTPSGGRLVKAELPPVKQAITRSRSPSAPAAESSDRAAALLRAPGIGCSASTTSTRRNASSGACRATTRPPASRWPRTRSSAAAIVRLALPDPSTMTVPSGSRRVADAADDQLIAVEPDYPLDGLRRVAGGEPGAGDAKRERPRGPVAVPEQRLVVADHGRTRLERGLADRR